MRRTCLVGTRISRNATRCNPDGWKLLVASSCTTMRTNGERPGESEEDERSGAKGDGKCTGDSGGRSATDGYRVFVGFLVPGDSQSTNPRAQSGDRDALGSATGARTHERRQDIRDA